MKLEIDLHDSRKERPAQSCHVLVFPTDTDGTIYHGITTVYSSRHDQFNNFDSQKKDKTPYGEQDGCFLYWAYFDDVKYAIEQAEVSDNG